MITHKAQSHRAGWQLALLHSCALAILLSGCTPDAFPTPPVWEGTYCEPCYCLTEAAPNGQLDVPVGVTAGDTDYPEVHVPDDCRLYHLAEQYETVVFSHSNHVDYADDCETCHHHSSKVEAAPPCRECHGLTTGDLRFPGLKGAYHRQCMNCHREMESGPLECEGCHAKAGPGVSKSRRALALEAVDDEIELGHLVQKFGAVSFDHLLHVEVTDNCEICHHEEKGYEKTPACRECHNTRDDLKNAYHEQCLACHKTDDQGPTDCEDCHERK
jgi:hypothetical protein